MPTRIPLYQIGAFAAGGSRAPLAADIQIAVRS